ncbi:MAG: apolipoprotein N-acyltransferase [Polyangiaceae bacterium]
MLKPPTAPIIRIALGCALSVLSATLLTLSFAPYNAWPLMWVGFVPMAVAQERILPSRLSALAPALGIGGYVAGCFGGVFPEWAAWYMKALPLLVGGIVLVSSWGGRARRERLGYAGWPLQVAIGWVAGEFLRSFIPALGTWGFVGYAMYRQTWFIQPVAAVGMFGLDVLIVLTNYAIAMLVIAMIDRRNVVDEGAGIALPVAARWCGFTILALVTWSASSIAMRQHDGPTVRVAALQPGRNRGQFGSTPEARDRAWIAVLAEQTRRASLQGARMVVWPEAVLRADPRFAYHDEIANLAREAGAYLFVGYRVDTPVGTRNEVATVGPDGVFLGMYGKAHPVVFLGGTSVSRGTYPTYDTPFGRVGAIICADIDFTDTAREMARRGARLLAVPSADWPAIAQTHYVNAVFRALETGAAVETSEYSRDSLIVEGSGAIVASAITPQGSVTVLVADVALHSGLPLAARFGDWVGWLCLAALLGHGVARRLRREDAKPMSLPPSRGALGGQSPGEA